MERGKLPDLRKIAILKPSPLGDLIFALPALDALRQTYPDAEVVLLGRDWCHALLPGRLSSIDRVVTLPAIEGVLIEPGLVPDPAEQAVFFDRMAAERFDLAIQLYGGGGYSNPVTRRLGARIAVGAREIDAAPLDRWLPYRHYQHEVLRNLEVVGLVGARTSRLAPRLPLSRADLAAARRNFPGIDGRFVVIHPGSTDARRRWPPERYARLADHCIERGYAVTVTGSDDERAIIDRLLAAMRGQAHDLSGRLDLPALAGLLAAARLVITNNTGPLHLALAVGGRAVGLFWAEQVVNTLPLFRERFHPLIAWRRDCPLCGAYIDKREFDNHHPAPCAHQASLLGEIEVEEVVRAVDLMLAG